MTPAEFSRAVLCAVRGAVEDGELSVTVPERVVVRAPGGKGVGDEADLACGVALQVAKEAGRSPLEVAEVLRERLTGVSGVAGVGVAGAGFLNVTLTGAARAGLVRSVLAQGRAYGDACGRGRVELRAAEGAGARAAVVAEAMERILPAGGAETRPGGETVRPRPIAHDWHVLTARLGPDEARWVLLRPAQGDAVRLPDRPVQRESNPRFRVQYGYARTRAMTRNARDLGFAAEPADIQEVGGTDTQSHALRDLYAAIAEYPAAVEAAARHRAPDRVARHLEVTADAWLRCHDVCPPLPVGEEKPSAVHRGRLALAEAAGTVLANGLHLLGISTPDRL
ncbi:ArgS-related anticodon-binding protein NrtL [Streptomyces rimosus]|uniref:ArgS-related anticodon-binding protein NrtL n=1 Tax=Streptomyces rimosus TaxID=1927 RepID=UPI0004C6CBC3|nr:DALR anticodon-binding domain-containing protein [Streptomyces rimosus]